jgi:hypothetical protein
MLHSIKIIHVRYNWILLLVDVLVLSSLDDSIVIFRFLLFCGELRFEQLLQLLNTVWVVLVDHVEESIALVVL